MFTRTREKEGVLASLVEIWKKKNERKQVKAREKAQRSLTFCWKIQVGGGVVRLWVLNHERVGRCPLTSVRVCVPIDFG